MGDILFVDCRPTFVPPSSLPTRGAQSGVASEQSQSQSQQPQSSGGGLQLVGGAGGGGGGASKKVKLILPIWLSIPGFMPLRVFAKRRAENRRQFYGKKIVAVDTNGMQASAFMANQARYHPKLALSTEMLLMTEKAATWLMSPKGRYMRWLVKMDPEETGLAAWVQRTREEVKEESEKGKG